jgi:hypothetical protein
MTKQCFSNVSHAASFARSERDWSHDLDPFSLLGSGAILLAVVLSALLALCSFFAF